MKKYFAIILTIFISVYAYMTLTPYLRDKVSVYKDGVSYVSMVDNQYFYIYRYGKWHKEFIKGVNVGAGKPGVFPGELAVTKEEYLRWFKEISDMNANTIRVYTILKPAFYEALYEYNKKSIKPIYVMHGVWVNEEDIANYLDAYNPQITDKFKKDIENLVDILHGNCSLPESKGYASGAYTRDVSQYVTGWILGIEWDPEFVKGTDAKNADKTNYRGKYLYTENASPFEAWLAMAGDHAIEYETKKYNMQRPLSYVNWPTTDVLKHPNEPDENEDMVVVNTEHIRPTKEFKPGLFASYHIYPYYPEFMSYDSKYRNFIDASREKNPYMAYLRDLRKEHTRPVVVAEFGVPASRGISHVNPVTGFNQGNIDEKTQGKMDESMLQDIYDEGYAGGMVFTWQDEWFKRTWNTMDLDISDRRAYWSNAQTNEQQFGLLAFDPGAEKSVCYVDGDISEWKRQKPVSSGEKVQLYVNSDEKYIYFMAKTQGYDFDNDTLLIPVDIIDNQGNTNMRAKNINLNLSADFVISVNGKDNSRILVDPYYDVFYYIYHNQEGMIEEDINHEIKNSGKFNPIYLCLNGELYLPEDKKTLKLSKFETGKLLYGDSNPGDSGYSSLADFNYKDGNIEIRIPWQLLNVMDPSTKMIMGDLHSGGIKAVETKGINISSYILGSKVYEGEKGFYSWKKWEAPKYHERLKPSYYILKDAFKKIGEK